MLFCRNGLLPIVMGAPKSDYTRAAPPNSFIHVDDFSSPRQLAEYFHLLNSDDEMYNRYFDWTDKNNKIKNNFISEINDFSRKNINF